MHRKQFLATLGRVGAGGFAATAARPAAATPAIHAKRAVTGHVGEVSAPPEAVFPLLCPVREYEWLDGWTCEMIYSESGVAEENCVFRTPLGPSTWNVNRYEPPKRIDFTVMSAEQVLRLTITLEPTATGGTKLTWKRTFTGLNAEGNAKIAFWTPDRDRALMRRLDHFLKTGKMQRDP